MKKALFISALMISTLFSNSNTDVLGLFIEEKKLPNFDKRFVPLANDAKILKEVEITYESSSGKIEKKRVVINELIDNKDTLLIAKNSTLEIASALYSPIFDASLQTTPVMSYSENKEENHTLLQADMKEKVDKEDNAGEMPTLSSLENKKTKNLPKKVWDDFITTELINSNLKITTKDTLKEEKNLTKDQKIVLDFTHDNIGLATKSFDINKYGFKNITFGAHPTYYRVVIRIDRTNQPYRVQKIKDGYMIILR